MKPQTTKSMETKRTSAQLRAASSKEAIRARLALSVPVLAKCEPDKSERHQDGTGHHQPPNAGIPSLRESSFPPSDVSNAIGSPAPAHPLDCIF